MGRDGSLGGVGGIGMGWGGGQVGGWAKECDDSGHEICVLVCTHSYHKMVCSVDQSQRDMTDDVCQMIHVLVLHNGLFVHAFVRVHPFHPMLFSM